MLTPAYTKQFERDTRQMEKRNEKISDPKAVTRGLRRAGSNSAVLRNCLDLAQNALFMFRKLKSTPKYFMDEHLLIFCTEAGVIEGSGKQVPRAFFRAGKG